MTTAMQNRWPLYALLGVNGVLALSRAYTKQRRQRQLRSGEIRELRGQWWKVNGQLMHARVALDPACTATPAGTRPRTGRVRFQFRAGGAEGVFVELADQLITVFRSIRAPCANVVVDLYHYPAADVGNSYFSWTSG